MIKSTAKLQNAFHSDIDTYFNGGVLSRSDLYISVLTPWVTFTRYARAIIQKHRQLLAEIPIGSGPKLNIVIEPYKGKNPHVQQMINYLSEHLEEDLIGAYVHGSLGTYEEIAYSDFDALVILKNNVFESPSSLAKVAMKLNTARSIMFGFDPLQHHGWFVLTEVDLKYYCNAYFPIELFKYAKSLFDDKGLELEISLRKSNYEAHKAFEKMANAIIRKIKNRQYPMNMCQLKSLLSQFMLLPTLYVEARDKKGIYKKFSFEAARSDFSNEDWAIMDEMSSLRKNWFYKISFLQRWLIARPTHISRFFAKKYGPAIPNQIKRMLTDNFYRRIQRFVVIMQRNLK